MDSRAGRSCELGGLWQSTKGRFGGRGICLEFRCPSNHVLAELVLGLGGAYTWRVRKGNPVRAIVGVALGRTLRRGRLILPLKLALMRNEFLDLLWRHRFPLILVKV